MKKAIAILALYVLGGTSAKAQTCTVNFGSGYSTPQTYSGSADSGISALAGGGKGPVIDTTRADGGFYFASVPIGTAFTVIAKVSLAAFNGGGGGIVSYDTTNELIWFGPQHDPNGASRLMVVVAAPDTTGLYWNSFATEYNQPIPLAYPFYLRLTRSSGHFGISYSAAYSANGTSWTAVFTSQGGDTPGPTNVGLGAWSGNNNGNYGILGNSSVTINGSTPSFSYSNVFTTGAPGMLTQQIQAGSLTLGTNLVAGSAVTGTCPGGQLKVFHNLILTDLTTGHNLIGSTISGLQFPIYPVLAPSCPSGCTFSYDYGSNDDGDGDSNQPFSPVTITAGHTYQILTQTYLTEYYECGLTVCSVNSPTVTFYFPMNP